MECLMDNLDDDLMNQDCEKRLLEIEFFVVRDFKLAQKFLIKYFFNNLKNLN